MKSGFWDRGRDVVVWPLRVAGSAAGALCHPWSVLLVFLAAHGTPGLSRAVYDNAAQIHVWAGLLLASLLLLARWTLTSKLIESLWPSLGAKLDYTSFAAAQLAHVPAFAFALPALLLPVEANVAGFIVIPGLLLSGAATVGAELLILMVWLRGNDKRKKRLIITLTFFVGALLFGAAAVMASLMNLELLTQTLSKMVR